MDTTYRDKFQKEVKCEILKASWVRFINRFMSQPIFTNEHIARIFKLIFEYLQSSGYASLPSDQTRITSLFRVASNVRNQEKIWKRLVYNENNDDKNEEYEFCVYIRSNCYSKRFECIIYTFSQFENKDPHDWINGNYYRESKVYENHEFKLVQVFRQ
jgi:hypothetical protein